MAKTTVLSTLIAAIFSGIKAQGRTVQAIVEARTDKDYDASEAVTLFNARLEKEVNAGDILSSSALVLKSNYRKLLECDIDHLIAAAAESDSVQGCYRRIVAMQREAGAGVSKSGAKSKAKSATDDKATALPAIPDNLGAMLDTLRALRAKLPALTAACADEFDALIAVVNKQVAEQKARAEQAAKSAKTKPAKEAATA